MLEKLDLWTHVIQGNALYRNPGIEQMLPHRIIRSLGNKRLQPLSSEVAQWPNGSWLDYSLCHGFLKFFYLVLPVAKAPAQCWTTGNQRFQYLRYFANTTLFLFPYLDLACLLTPISSARKASVLESTPFNCVTLVSLVEHICNAAFLLIYSRLLN